MTAEFSKLNLRDDFDDVLGTADAKRWQLSMPTDLEVVVSLSSAAVPAEAFEARLLWNRYPDEAPSLKFRDRGTGRLDMPQAWPLIRGFRPQSLDACVNWCKEGLAIHPEWRADPRFAWDKSHNPLLRVLRTLQDEFDNFYLGRFK
jgi:hypothetical protein